MTNCTAGEGIRSTGSLKEGALMLDGCCTCGHAQLCLDTLETLRTVACQALLSMEFSRQEYWSGLPFPTSGHLPDPGIKLASPVSPARANGFFTTVPPGKPWRDVTWGPCCWDLLWSEV